MDDLTQLLEKAQGGDAPAVPQLYEAVYRELRAMAANKMAVERPGHTLQPTALVNEAYLRLARSDGVRGKAGLTFFALPRKPCAAFWSATL